MDIFNNTMVGAFSLSQASQRLYQWIEQEFQQGYIAFAAKGIFILGIAVLVTALFLRLFESQNRIFTFKNGLIMSGLSLLFIDGGVWIGNLIKGIIDTGKTWLGM